MRREWLKCERNEELVSGEQFREGLQSIVEVDEFIEIKKDMQDGCQAVSSTTTY
jgi:hypothetical protein